MRYTDIKKIYYNGDEVKSLVLGGNVIYSKVEEPLCNPRLLKGKFALHSTSSDWYCYINGTKTNIPVDNSTNEFEYEVDGNTDIVSMSELFAYNDYIERIDSLPDTSNVTKMDEMFYGCDKLKSVNLNNINTCNVDNMFRMLAACKIIESWDLSNFDTSNVTNMEQMFTGCNNLKSLNLGNNFNTENVTNMYSMLSSMKVLTTLNLGDKFDTSKVTNMLGMFAQNSKLKTLHLGDKFDMGNVTNAKNMFLDDYNLTDVTGTISNIKLDIDFSATSRLTNDSAMVFINGLADVTSTKKITFKSTTYGTLSQEQIALATSKGWSVIKKI